MIVKWKHPGYSQKAHVTQPLLQQLLQLELSLFHLSLSLHLPPPAAAATPKTKQNCVPTPK